MPKIPGARERLSTNVPSRRASGDGQILGKALSGFGGQMATIANDINSRRKRLTDLDDFHKKSTDLSLDWENTKRKIQLDLERDGTLPESAYGTNEDGTKKTLVDVTDEFWEDRVSRYSETMGSDESRQMFMQNALASKDRNLLQADSTLFKLQVDNSQRILQENSQQRQKIVANQTQFDLAQTENFLNLDFAAIEEKRQAETLTRRQALAMQNDIQQGYAETILNKFENEGNWVDMLYFLDSGTKASGQDKKFGFMSDEQVKQMSERTGVDLKVQANRFDGKQMQGVAAALPKNVVEAYRDKALRRSEEDNFLARQRLDQNIADFKQQAYSGEINVAAKAGEFKGLMDSIRNRQFPGSRADKARLLAEVSMAGTVNNIFMAGSFMSESSENRKKMIRDFESQDMKSILNSIAEFAPETRELNEQLLEKTPATMRGIKNDAMKMVKKVDEYLENAYAEDFAGTAIQYDKTLQGHWSPPNRNLRKYFDRANFLARKQGILNPNLVPGKEIEKFKQMMSKAADSPGANTAKAATLTALATDWGNAWSRVKHEYAGSTDLSSEIQVASMLVGEQGWIENDTANLLKLNSTERKNIFERLPLEVRKSDIVEEIRDNDSAGDFLDALDNSYQVFNLPTGVINSFSSIMAADTAQTMSFNDEDIDESTTKVVSKYINNAFWLSKSDNSKIFMPKSLVKNRNEAAIVQDFIEANEGDEGMLNLRKYFSVPDEFKRQVGMIEKDPLEVNDSFYRSISTNGKWVTAPDGSGLMFSSPTEAEPLPFKNGNIIMPWSEIIGE